MNDIITQDHVDTFQNDGVVLIRGLFDGYIDTLRQGVEQNLNSPGPYAAENLQSGESGRFFDDYCNWHRIAPFEQVIREWTLEPGDAVAFTFSTLHGARGNHAATRRRAFSLRLLGDDARYVERPGPTSPPFPGHAMQAGDRLREDWFPMIYSRVDD